MQYIEWLDGQTATERMEGTHGMDGEQQNNARNNKQESQVEQQRGHNLDFGSHKAPE